MKWILISIALLIVAVLGGLAIYNSFGNDSIVGNLNSAQLKSTGGYKSLSHLGVNLTDSTVYDSSTNTCSGTRLGMSITIKPCIAQSVTGTNIQQFVNFTWNGASPQNTSWLFIYDQPLKSGSIGVWQNHSYTYNVQEQQNQWVTNYLITGITGTTNLGTPNASCQVGNANNTQMYRVVRTNGTVSTTIYCFTDVTVVNSSAYRISGNYDATVTSTKTGVRQQFVDITSSIKPLGNLLGDEFQFYEVSNVVFQPGQSIYTDWKFTPANNSLKGKWHIFGYPADQTPLEAIANNQYIYIDPWWNSSFTKAKTVNITGSTEQLINFTVYLNVSQTATSDFQSDFDDIRFVANACNDTQDTELNYEFDKIITNVSAGVWVRVPLLKSSMNLNENVTQICMYYSNPTATNGENAPMTWDNHYTIVMHFTNTTSGYYKNSKDGNTTFMALSGGAASPEYVPGVFGDALNLSTSGANRYAFGGAEPSACPTFNPTFSTEMWSSVYGTASLGWYRVGFNYLYDKSNVYGFKLNPGYMHTGSQTWSVQVDATAGVVDRKWQNMYGNITFGSSPGWAFLDKVLYTGAGGGSGGSCIAANWQLSVENPGSNLNLGNSDYDEIRFSNISRSPGWVNRSYDNSNMSFFTFGAEQTNTGGGSNSTLTGNTTLTNPIPVSSTSNETFNFFRSSFNTNGNFTNATLYIMNSTTTLTYLNTTFEVSVFFPFYHNFTSFNVNVPDGNYSWNVLTCFTNSTNYLCKFAPANRTILIDSTYPTIEYGFGTAPDGANVSQNWVYMNVSAYDLNEKNISFNLYNSSFNILPVYQCYQEFANQSTTCGGLDTGTYFKTGNLVESNFIAIIDGDWSTSGAPSGGIGTLAALYINYTKPLGSTNATWEMGKTIFQSGGIIFINFSIPDSCFNNGYDKLVLAIDWQVDNAAHYVCFNSTNWIQLGESPNNARGVFEEAIIWNTPFNIFPFGTRFHNFTNLPDGTYYYNVTITDIVNHQNTTPTRAITLGTFPPTINLTTPANNTFTNNTTQNLTANITSVTGINYTSLYVYNHSGTLLNNTNQSGFANIYNVLIGIPYTFLYDGIFNWFYQAVDLLGNTKTSNNNTIIIDTVQPGITITYPLNTTYLNVSVTHLNYTISDLNPQACWYSLFENFTLPTVATSCYGRTASCTGGGDGNFSTQSGITSLGLATNEFVYNYTYQHGFGNSFNVSGIIHQVSVGGGGVIMAIRCYNWLIADYVSFTNWQDSLSSNVNISFSGTLPSTCWNPGTGQFQIAFYDNGFGVQAPNWTIIDMNFTGGENPKNTTITCGTNISGLNPSEGSNTWIVYANDSAGNWNYSSVTFFMHTDFPVIQFISPTTTSGSRSNNTIISNVQATDFQLVNITTRLFNVNNVSINETTTSLSPQLLQYTLADGIYYLNATACDSANQCSSTETRVYNIDTSIPSIQITAPVNGGVYVDQSIVTNNSKTIVVNFTVSNSTSCWFNISDATGGKVVNSSNVSCSATTANFNLYYGTFNITLAANNSFGTVIQTTNQARYGVAVLQNALTANETSFETETQGFVANITIDPTFTTSSARLEFNGSFYTPIVSTTNVIGGNTIFLRSINIPTLDAGSVKKNYFWNFTLSNASTTSEFRNKPSIVYTMNVTAINFTSCNPVINITYLNFTYQDETTLQMISAFSPSGTFTFFLGTGTQTKTYFYSNLAEMNSTPFCFYPNHRSVSTAINYNYQSGAYQLRNFGANFTLSNSSTNQVLQLLSSSLGINVAFQVVQQINIPISGATVTVSRLINGVPTQVGSAVTGNDGISSFWLNPSFAHTVTVTKAGFVSTSQTLTPTQPTYTIFMSASGQENTTFASSVEGIRWKKTPTEGPLSKGLTIFGLNLTADLGNLENCRIQVKNLSGHVYATQTGLDSASSCNISVSLNTTSINDKRLFGVYSIDTTNSTTFFEIESDTMWYLLEKNNTLTLPATGIKSFFNSLTNAGVWGTDVDRENYSRIVFFFIMLTVIMGAFIFFTGFEMNSPGLASIPLFFIFLFANYGGFISSNLPMRWCSRVVENGMVTNNVTCGAMTFLNTWLVSIIAFMFTLGFILNTWRKQS